MNNNIIKNKIYIYGDGKDVTDLKKFIRSDNSLVDFNEIEPMTSDSNDFILDDFMNFCLNVYIKNHLDMRQQLIHTIEFVGKTRRYPYKFKELTIKETFNIITKNNYKIEFLLKDAEIFLKAIKDKSIFNGYMIRDALWGTGSNPVNVKVKYNTLKFDTFDKAPVKVFIKLSKMYPEVVIDYTYQVDNGYTKIRIKNGNVEILENQNQNYAEPSLYRLITDNVLI